MEEYSLEAFKGMSMAAFLQPAESGEHFTGTKSQLISFSKCFKQYENGELKPTSKKRTQESKFKAVEDKLVHNISLCQSLYQCDKCGLSWIMTHAAKEACSLGCT
jgi:fatty acid-binding protein DegV